MLILIICALHFDKKLNEQQMKDALRAITVGKDHFWALNMVDPLPYVPEFVAFKCNKTAGTLTFNHTCACGFTEQYDVRLRDTRSLLCPACKKVTQ